jgi:hypothetical protein
MSSLSHHAPSGLRLHDRPLPTDAFLAHLAQTEFGTRGLRFFMDAARQDATRLGRAHFLTLETAEGQVRGTYALVPGALVPSAPADGDRVPSLYRTFLTVDPALSGQSVGRWLSGETRRLFCDEASGPVVIYGFIDPDNARSMKIALHNRYESLLPFDVLNAGWHRPADDPRVQRLAPGERPAFLQAVRACHPGHVLPDLQTTSLPDELWVLREGGEIVCGAQAVPRSLRITGLGGVSGRLILWGQPVLARLSPLFALRDRRFCWLGSLFARPGAEGLLGVLLQALQRRLEVHGAIAYFDRRTPLYERLRTLGAFGPLHGLSPTTELRVMAGASPAAAPWLARHRDRPWLFSAFDCA